MHIETTFTAEDFNQLSKELPAFRRRLLYLLIVSLVYIAIGLLVFRTNLPNEILALVMFFVVLFGAPVLFVTWIKYFLSVWRMRNATNKALQNANASSLTYKFDIDEDGVTRESALSKISYKWGGFTKWQKLGAYYLLYVSTLSFLPIKVSDIPSDKVQEFESLLKNIIQSAK
jgi:Na+/proline symporter